MIFSKTSDAIRTKKVSETAGTSIADKECKWPFHFHSFCSSVRSFVAKGLSNSAILSIKLGDFVRRFRGVCKQERYLRYIAEAPLADIPSAREFLLSAFCSKRPVPFRAEQGVSQGSVLYSLRSFSLIIFSMSAFPIAPVCI